jgi:hypothetical protein
MLEFAEMRKSEHDFRSTVHENFRGFKHSKIKMQGPKRTNQFLAFSFLLPLFCGLFTTFGDGENDPKENHRQR